MSMERVVYLVELMKGEQARMPHNPIEGKDRQTIAKKDLIRRKQYVRAFMRF
jgi:hypothetical protein